MSDQGDLIAWKTAAWKDPAMVKGYAARMRESAGGNFIKNRVEVDLCRRNAVGPRILDVGVGTGRASLPLAREGFRVTGVDSSQAMLDTTRALAGDTPIDLRIGDVAALPFEDDSFDTVMALNTVVHFPHWETIVAEWKRVARPAGRLVFDVFSLDHDRAYAAALGRPPEDGVAMFAPADVGSYYLRVGARELAQGLTRVGLQIAAVEPYGALFGRAGFNRWLDDGTLATGNAWDRLLSWSAENPFLLKLCVLLEEQLLAYLPTTASCRFMVVADNVPDDGSNERWYERDRAFSEALAREGLARNVVSRFVPQRDWDTFASDLQTLLEHPPNVVVFFKVLTGLLRWQGPRGYESWVQGESRAEIARLLRLEMLNRDVVEMLQSWHSRPPVGELMQHAGVDLGRGLEYEMMTALLDHAMHAFEAQA